ncbi:unnamed protein product [Arctia plantaginis]|uniref:HAT C-terminal dimerisation domain-containing protein n=1 Tax=Arctia plantaginis TaxID=874455 RepID=A0A8S1BLF3_ARCPL|nr:unnamed protein product [Arctia plantaginis]
MWPHIHNQNTTNLVFKQNVKNALSTIAPIYLFAFHYQAKILGTATKPKKRKITSNDNEDNASVGKSSEGDPAPAFESTSTLEDGDNCHKNDIGRWVGRSFVMTTEMRMEMLKRCWAPPENYDYAGDAAHLKRKFNHSWLEMYKPWLVYSKKSKAPKLRKCMDEVSKFYELEGITSEAELWRTFWVNKQEDFEDLEITELIQQAECFYLNVKTALEILLAMPYSTATIERSFSTLRRVKTWLRSTMIEDRLN